MKKRNRYVLLDTNTLNVEYYYCLSDETVYEQQTWYGKHPTASPRIHALVSNLIGLIIGSVIAVLYICTFSNIIVLLIALTCVIMCANDYYRRQKQLALTKSQKSLSSFFWHLPCIEASYKGQKRGAIFLLISAVISLFFIGISPFPTLLFFSFCATGLYFSLFRIGIFHKKQVIKQIERMYEIEKRKREQEQEENLEAQEKWDL